MRKFIWSNAKSMMRPSQVAAVGTAFLMVTSLAWMNTQDASSEESQSVQLSSNQPDRSSHAPDRILIRMRDSTVSALAKGGSAPSQKQVMASAALSLNSTGLKLGTFANGQALRALDSSGQTLAVAIDPTMESVESAIARVSQHPDVALAQPDYRYRRFAVPNDTEYGLLWGLKNTGQTIPVQHSRHSRYGSGLGTAGRDMSLESAWDKITDCSTVVVAVIDTGINLQHTDLVDNLWDDGMGNHGYDFVNDDNDPDDDEGHGTHVAGTIGARGNNASGTTGICWQVKLMAVKVLDADGSGFTSDIVAGVNYAAANGAHIINMSLGGTTLDTTFRTAVQNASNDDILIVVAAGNSGVNASTTYPCAFQVDNLICVGAVDQRYAKATFSNYSNTIVHIGAPGTNIASAALGAITTDTVSLTTGWTANGDWATPANIQAPANFDGTTNRYSRNLVSTIYQTFDLTNVAKSFGSVTFQSSLESPSDTFEIHATGTANVDPSTDAFGINYASYSGTSAATTHRFEIINCRVSQCSIGFRLESGDDDNQLYGVRISSIFLVKYLRGTTGYDTLNGTSMASPHVAGLAALVKAYNPTFTTAEIRDAILKTGTRITSLGSLFREGSVANAANALKFIPKPAAPSVAVQ